MGSNKIITPDDFGNFVKEVEDSEGYRRPLAFGVGIANTSQSGETFLFQIWKAISVVRQSLQKYWGIHPDHEATTFLLQLKKKFCSIFGRFSTMESVTVTSMLFEICLPLKKLLTISTTLTESKVGSELWYPLSISQVMIQDLIVFLMLIFAYIYWVIVWLNRMASILMASLEIFLTMFGPTRGPFHKKTYQGVNSMQWLNVIRFT